MGFDKPNDEDHGQDAIPNRESGAVDYGQISSADHNSSAAQFMPLPFMLPAISSWQNMHGTLQSYPYDPRTGNNLMTSVVRHNNLQSLQVDPSFSNLGGGLRKVDACSSGFQNTQVNENFMPTRSNTAGGYQRNDQIGEPDGSNINWSQVTQSSLNLGSGASMPHQNTNILQTGINNSGKVSAFHPGKVDGSFLTLGIGINPEARAKTKFSHQEIASKLEEAVAPKSSSNNYIQPATGQYPNLTGGFSSFSNNSVGFADPLSNFGGWTSHNNDDRVIQGVTVGMISDPYLSPHLPEVFKPHDFFENSSNNTGFLDKSIRNHLAPQPYIYSQGGPSPSSFPFNNTYFCLPQPGYAGTSEFSSETSKPTWITTQPTRDLLGISQSRNIRDVSSSFGSHSSRARGSSITKDYLGISMVPSEGTATQAADSLPQSTSIRPDGQLSAAHRVYSANAFGNNTFPENTRLQMAESSANRPATGAPFPRRLGVQINDAAAASAATQSSNQCVLPMDVGVQARSKILSSDHQASLAAQSNFQRTSFSTGQPRQTPPAQICSDLPRVHTSGQVLPNTKAGGPSHVYDRNDQPSNKRRANEPPAVVSWGQRRRLVTVPSHSTMGTSNSKAAGPSQVSDRTDQQSLKRGANEPPAVVSWGQRRRLVTVPANSTMGIPSTPSTSAHIRWTGFDSPLPPQPTGQRCMICKRDLSFTPEGPVSTPSIPPAVAVLPCGHTFHDHCLQNITPEEQAHEPPCIPCAIGET